MGEAREVPCIGAASPSFLAFEALGAVDSLAHHR